MINKLLCFMWGHVYKDAIDVHMFWPWECKDDFIVEKCKHCGEIKNNP